MIAIIGGSGLTRLPEMNITHRRIVRTPYGLPSSPLMMGKLGSHEIMFIARHGLNHTLSPHEINYRANIWALHSAKQTTLFPWPRWPASTKRTSPAR